MACNSRSNPGLGAASAGVPRRRVRARGARGFALPVVVLLALVGAVLAAAMLRREEVQRLQTQRQLDSYRDHHFSRGVREVVGQWAISLSGQPIEKMIAPDGRVLDLELADGGLVRVFMADGQGAALSDVSKATGEERADAERILANLMEITRGRPDPAWVRDVGPVRISAGTAPEAVVEAVARVVTSTEGAATALARTILNARRDGPLTEAGLASAVGRAGLSGDQVSRFNRLFTAKPELWLMTVEVFGPGRDGKPQREPGFRYVGRVSLGQAGAGAFAGAESLGSFLSWEALPVR